ncbi:MAG TPA: hypothetical protein PLD02_08730, partial [Saprospiraceae bacterium]|nr:hypothetical protein [Saprospiraceae bacterium]
MVFAWTDAFEFINIDRQNTPICILYCINYAINTIPKSITNYSSNNGLDQQWNINSLCCIIYSPMIVTIDQNAWY